MSALARMHSAIASAPRSYSFLDEEEGRFVACAISRLLPEHDSDSLFRPAGAVAFIDERLQAGDDCLLQLAIDLGIGEIRLTGAQVAKAYREGIAAVQRYCRARYGAVFQDLTPPRQHLVLGLLERGEPSAGLSGHAVLFSLLVQHAAEAYFDATNIALVSAQRR